MVNLKANKAKRFVSILGFNKNGVKGRTSICCPLSDKFYSESKLFRNLKLCLEEGKPKKSSQWKMKSLNVERVDV